MRKIIWQDFETGGVQPFVHSPLSFAMIVTEGRQIKGEWYTEIRQAPFNVTPEAMAINKLNLEDSGLDFNNFRKEYFTRINNWCYGGTDYARSRGSFLPGKIKADKFNMPKYGGHNTWFDRQCLQNILSGTPYKNVFDGCYYHHVDTMVLGSTLQEIGLLDPSQPMKLENLCNMLELKQESGEFHNALVDLKMTVACYFKMQDLIRNTVIGRFYDDSEREMENEHDTPAFLGDAEIRTTS